MASQFWEMTPREIQAFGKVKQAHDERRIHIEEHRTRLWAVQLVDFRNVYFRGRGRQPWTVDEILNTKKTATPAGLPMVDPEEFKIKMIMSGFMRDSDVPEWARATVAASKALEESQATRQADSETQTDRIKQGLLEQLPRERL